MNLKMNLIYLSLLTGMVTFSNQAVNAQGSAAIFQADATNNLLKRSAQDINQGELCLGSTTNQISYKSRFETRDEKSEFIALIRKYYRKDAEINKASPVVLNSSFNYYAFTNDSTTFYLNKSKHQQTAAWILLGAGTTMALVGMIGAGTSETEMFGQLIYASDLDAAAKASSKAGTYIAIMLTGIAADLVSIPFFVSASRNKKRPVTFSFGNQTIYSPLDKSNRNVVPSLTLRVKL